MLVSWYPEWWKDTPWYECIPYAMGYEVACYIWSGFLPLWRPWVSRFSVHNLVFVLPWPGG